MPLGSPSLVCTTSCTDPLSWGIGHDTGGWHVAAITHLLMALQPDIVYRVLHGPTGPADFVTLTDREETISLLERNTSDFTQEHCQKSSSIFARPRRKNGKALASGTATAPCAEEAPKALLLDWSEPVDEQLLLNPAEKFQVILAADCPEWQNRHIQGFRLHVDTVSSQCFEICR
eukprot:s1021_g8.t1